MENIEDKMIGTHIYDTEGREYIIKQRVAEGAQGIIYETNNGLMIKINYSKDISREEMVRRYTWIMRQNITKAARMVLPIAILDEPYIGYVMEKVRGHIDLGKYINKPNNISLSEWYNHQTGGIKKRLEIGALLGKSLRNLHISGITYCDLSPSNVLVAEKKQSIALIDPDNLTSTTSFKNSILGTPRYIAPELFKGNSQPNSLSDIYSYAVILFEMLRLGHPLLGDAIINGTPEQEEEALKGNAIYIDHPEDESNRNSRLQQTECLVTDDLKKLFERVFVDGLSKPIRRPTLNEFRLACVTARDQLVQCKTEGCNAAFYYNTNGENRCPWCDEIYEDILKITFMRKISLKEFKMLDINNFDEKNLSIPAEKHTNLILNEGSQSINRRHFDPSISLDNDEMLIGVVVDKKGKIYVQKLKDIQVFVFNKETKKYRELLKGKFEIIERKKEALILNEAIDISEIKECFGDATIANYAAFY